MYLLGTELHMQVMTILNLTAKAALYYQPLSTNSDMQNKQDQVPIY